VYKTNAYSAAGEMSPLASTAIPRRDPGEHDVQIEMSADHDINVYLNRDASLLDRHGVP
jgi:hypothetical protein